MFKRFTRIALAVMLGLVTYAVVAAQPSQAAGMHSWIVRAAQDEPVATQGQVFYTGTIYIDKESPSTPVTISGSRDGTADFYVDDLLQAVITRADGAIATLQVDDSAGCTADHVITTPPRNISQYLSTGLNKISFTFKDSCGGDYGNSDIYVTGKVDSPNPRPTLAKMDGGTFIAVIYDQSLSGEECTSAFSVLKNGIRYMVTAKHCFDGNQKNDDQTTNKNIPAHAPLDVRTNDKHQTYAFVTELSCLIGQSGCLLPVNKSVPGDMVAFKPDTAVPTDLVQTSYRNERLPVVGEIPWVKGQVLCHYGAGIAGQACGKVTSKTADSGLVTYNASSRCGDSGGPVFTYTYDASGVPNGVLVAGIQVTGGAGSDGCRVGPAGQFIPVSTIEATLGATLVTGPPAA